MSEIPDDDPDVGFLVRTMLTRDPKKRQVKPVQHHMLTLDFPGLDDSEDDDDYTLPQSKGGETSESEEGSESESEDSDEQEESTEQIAEDDLLGQTQLIDHTLEENVDTVMSVESTATAKQIKVLICGVCLQDYSGDNDEIVECDGCGVAVHEGCYGMTEATSVASTVSSASTEPWFCEPCKAGVKPCCELCPNAGGIFKETDASRWCHLVCALYVPGVAFGDIDQLTPITLFEMPYSKWGAKECILCEDSRFSRTGVCIGCDAGLCRNYFHVTCAQREGLLSEASPDEDIADPFFAHCKQHAEKMMMKMKRRNWLATQSRLRTMHEEEREGDVAEKIRVKRKLERHKRKYTEAKANSPPCWIPQEKMPRMLTSSATALRKLMKKAELLGINNQNVAVIAQTDVRKKWHLAPAFTVDYFSYFMDRNERILKMRAQQKDLAAVKEKLKTQEKGLRHTYEQLSSSVSLLRTTHSQLFDECTQLWQHVTQLSKKTLKLPTVLKPTKVSVASECERLCVSSPTVIQQCSVCESKEDQHLLVQCDECRLFYHLGCLDPPLTRMPKKTKLYGWQCSQCIRTSSDDSDVSVDTNAPMRLRETIKEPQKFSAIQTEQQKKKPEKKKKIVKKPVKSQEKSETQSPHSHPLTKTVKRSPIKSKKDVDIRRECSACGRPGDNSTLVRCDECKNCYHFHCLDPPMKQTPKQAGYGWICTGCTSSDSESGGYVGQADSPLSEVTPYQSMEPTDEHFLVLGVESEEIEDMDMD